MYNLKTLNDKYSKLKAEANVYIKKNDELLEQIDDLDEKRDKNLIFGFLTVCGMVVVLVSSQVIAGFSDAVLGVAAGLLGTGFITVAVKDLMIGRKISKLDKERLSNCDIIGKIQDKQYKVILAKEEVYNKQQANNITNENKQNLINNNHFVNSVTNSRNKVRSLELTKRNTRRFD